MYIYKSLSHCFSFQEHIASNPPNKVLEVDEFLALRKEVRHMLKHDVTSEPTSDNPDVPPGDDDSQIVSETFLLCNKQLFSNKILISEQ